MPLKASAEQREQMARRYHSGESADAIAAEFGVAPFYVRHRFHLEKDRLGLGTRHRPPTAIVAALKRAADNNTPVTARQIADECGVEIYAVRAAAKRSGYPLVLRGWRPSADGPMSVKLDRYQKDKLKAEARRRGLTAGALAAQLLSAITDDDLIDAILDDAGAA